jgi:ATP-dependent Clp protease adaptor protein ClpS
VVQHATPTPTRAADAAEPARAPLYHLVLLDDSDHTYAYVIEMLGRVLGYDAEKAYALACIVDSAGRVIVETAGHDQVTGHQRQIHGYGPDPRIRRCKGSMSAVVEQAP